MPRQIENIGRINKSKRLAAATLGAISLMVGACGQKETDTRVTTQKPQDEMPSHQVNPLDDYEFIVDSSECPAAFQGIIGVNPDASWIHIIDGEVAFQSNTMNETKLVKDQTQAKDYFCTLGD